MLRQVFVSVTLTLFIALAFSLFPTKNSTPAERLHVDVSATAPIQGSHEPVGKPNARADIVVESFAAFRPVFVLLLTSSPKRTTAAAAVGATGAQQQFAPMQRASIGYMVDVGCGRTDTQW